MIHGNIMFKLGFLSAIRKVKLKEISTLEDSIIDHMVQFIIFSIAFPESGIYASAWALISMVGKHYLEKHASACTTLSEKCSLHLA